jgi:phage-related protein
MLLLVAKPLRLLHGEIKTPPMSLAARREIGFHLRQLQEGALLALPASRPMPEIESGCHELRVRDEVHEWRLIYSVEPDAILILEVFRKSTRQTPKKAKETCRKRVREYRRLVQEGQ